MLVSPRNMDIDSLSTILFNDEIFGSQLPAILRRWNSQNGEAALAQDSEDALAQDSESEKKAKKAKDSKGKKHKAGKLRANQFGEQSVL